jgi:type II secretory pathway component PulK
VSRTGEQGYALVAAVASIAVFAAMALTVLSATRVAMADVGGEQAQLRAGAAADAGVALAISHMLATDDTNGWSPDGRIRRLLFHDAVLRVRVEDERGKVPVDALDTTQTTRLLEIAGLGGERLSIARDSLLDWLDTDRDPRPFGAEAPYYRAHGVVPADGLLASVDELALVRGFDAGVVDRLRPIVTTVGRTGGFRPDFADPRALAVMLRGGDANPAVIDRTRERAGDRQALAFTTTAILRRPIAVSVEAVLPDGARAVRRVLVELTGAPATPYLVRAYE